MNWKLILALSLFGPIIAVTALFGLGFMGALLWPIVAAGCAVLIAKFARGRYFLHGFLVSVLIMFWMVAVNAYYLRDVARNQVELVESAPGGFGPQVMNLLVGLAGAAVTGVIGGLFAFGAAKLFKRPETPEPESTA